MIYQLRTREGCAASRRAQRAPISRWKRPTASYAASCDAKLVHDRPHSADESGDTHRDHYDLEEQSHMRNSASNRLGDRGITVSDGLRRCAGAFVNRLYRSFSDSVLDFSLSLINLNRDASHLIGGLAQRPYN